MTSGSPNMRSFAKDRTVADHKLTRDTLKRILRFARPYRGRLAVFVALIAVEAAAGAVTPLLFKTLIDDGITAGDTRVVLDHGAPSSRCSRSSTAGLSVADRWVSSQVGEGLIRDLRTEVFDHVQRMPLAFFSRAKTGALVQRLNGDVLGAQQAFTSTLQNVVSNSLTIVFVLAAMFTMSWQLTLLSLVLLPAFIFPARWFGKKIAAITRESYALNADAAQIMNERFNVAGAHLVKIFGDPQRESQNYADQVDRVRDIGVTRALYSTWFRVGLTTLASVAVALVYGLGGVMAIRGELTVGVVVALTAYLGRLYGPLTAMSNVQVDVMTALVSFERVLEVLDLEPTVAEKPDATDLRAATATHGASVRLDGVSFRYPGADEVSLASLESVATLTNEVHQNTLEDVSLTVPAGHMVALVGHSGAGKTTISQLVTRMYDPTRGLGADRRRRPAGRHARLAARDGRRGQPGGAPLPRHHRGEPALRPPGGHRRRHRARAGAGAHRGPRRDACPTASTPWSATAATGCPAASGSASRSRGCCSRPPTSSSSTRPPRTSTPGRRPRSRPRSTRP